MVNKQALPVSSLLLQAQSKDLYLSSCLKFRREKLKDASKFV